MNDQDIKLGKLYLILFWNKKLLVISTNFYVKINYNFINILCL